MSVKGVQITKRDIGVFRLLQQFPLRTAEHIHSLCFSGTKYPAVGRRLKKLVDYQLLKRVVVVGEGGYRYYISNSVREYLDNNRALKRINKNFLKHDSELYDCLLHFSQAVQNDVTLIPDFQLSTYAKRGYRTTLNYKGQMLALDLSFLPDALIGYNGVAYFIEWDRASLMGINLFKKVSAFQKYFSESNTLIVDGLEYRDIKVVFICPSQSRVHAVAQAFEEHTSMSNVRVVTKSEWVDRLLDLNA